MMVFSGTKDNCYLVQAFLFVSLSENIMDRMSFVCHLVSMLNLLYVKFLKEKMNAIFCLYCTFRR
jgi:hypothetical protein